MSGLQSRIHRGWQRTVKRIHDGAIGDIVAVQSMFLRSPYQVVLRDPRLSETEYQFSNWLAVMGQIACYTGTETRWDAVCESDLRFGPAPDDSNFDTPPPTVPDQTGNYPLPMPGITKLL